VLHPLRGALALGLGLLSLGCGGEEGAPPPPAPASAPAAKPAGPDPAAVRAAAEQIFATRCFTCHGAQGAGDGPASAGLTPPPRNFTDPAWQSSVTDGHIEQIILYGGAAVGRSPMMPGNPDLTSKPEVVAALRAHVRGLAK
jgi:mono/diheme cytochrome c family protein